MAKKRPAPSNNSGRKNKAVKKPAAPPSPPPPLTWQRRLGQEAAALLLLGLGVFLALSLASFSLADPPSLVRIWFAPQISNWGGKAGAVLALTGMGLLGLGAFLLPLILGGLAWQSHRHGLENLTWSQVIAGLAVPAAGAGLLGLVRPYVSWGDGLIHTGGLLGDLLAAGLVRLLNWPWFFC